MSNKFFEEVRDESGHLWGYNFNRRIPFKNFTESIEKYKGLDISKPIYFKSNEYNRNELESILNIEGIASENEKVLHIIFEECKFRIQESVSFKNISIQFKSCSSQTGSFSFENCLNSDIKITDRTTFGVIHINKSNKISVLINDIIVREIIIKKVTNLDFKAENLFETKIIVENCEFKDFSVYNSKIKKLRFENTEGIYLTLSGISAENISLFGDHRMKIGKRKTFNYEFINILSCTFNNLYLNGTEQDLKLNSIEIKDTSNFTLASMNITSLTIIGTSLYNILVFSCFIKNLRFLYFKIKENVVFNLGEYGDGGLILDNAILKDLEINPSFLHEFKEIEFKGSSIVGLVVHSFKMINPKLIREMQVENENKIDFCRELNALMLVQNNRHYASVYRALELELRSKSEDPSMSWFDKQILNLNYWSNVHGTEPAKPLIWIFSMIVCHLFLIWLSIICQNTSLTFSEFLSQNYSYYFKPITFLSDLEKSYIEGGFNISFNSVFKILDFLYKIFYAYLLYQFIAAFRKFNK